MGSSEELSKTDSSREKVGHFPGWAGQATSQSRKEFSLFGGAGDMRGRTPQRQGLQ